MWSKDFNGISAKEKIYSLLNLIVFEFQCLPMIHTLAISIVKDSKENNETFEEASNDLKFSFHFQKLRDEINLARKRPNIYSYPKGS